MSKNLAAEAVRARFRARRGDSQDRLIQIPFVVDIELADKVMELVNQKQDIERRISRLADHMDELEQDPDEDVRADGRDLTPNTEALAVLEESLASLDEQLEEMKEAVREGSATMFFRLATDKEYEEHLAEVEREHGGPDRQQSVTVAFGNRLLNSTFVRIEHEGADLGYATWEELHDDMQLTFGDVDPIRTAVIAKNRRSGAFKLPF